MKLLHSLIMICVFSVCMPLTEALACEIEFTVEGEQKEVYKTGDIVIVKVKVVLTHRVCPVAMSKTKFEPNGFKIEGATDWKEVSPNVWERKLKMKVTGNKKGKLMISATRTCDKEGGFGSLTLQGEPLK